MARKTAKAPQRTAVAKKELMRIEQSAAVGSAAFGCAGLLDAGLEEVLGPATTEEQTLLNGGGLAMRIGRRLAFLRQSYEAAKEALARVEDELRRERRRRDRAFDELYPLARNFRKTCSGLYGKAEGDEFLGLHGDLPRTPKELHDALAPAIGRLADDEWPTPRRTTRSLTADRKGLVNEFAKVHGRLGRALGVIAERETREAVLKAATRRAKKAVDDFTGKSARFLEAGLDLAGLDDLVGIVRPGVGRRGRPLGRTQLDTPAPVVGLPAADTPKALPAPSADETDETDDL